MLDSQTSVTMVRMEAKSPTLMLIFSIVLFPPDGIYATIDTNDCSSSLLTTMVPYTRYGIEQLLHLLLGFFAD